MLNKAGSLPVRSWGETVGEVSDEKIYSEPDKEPLHTKELYTQASKRLRIFSLFPTERFAPHFRRLPVIRSHIMPAQYNVLEEVIL